MAGWQLAHYVRCWRSFLLILRAWNLHVQAQRTGRAAPRPPPARSAAPRAGAAHGHRPGQSPALHAGRHHRLSCECRRIAARGVESSGLFLPAYPIKLITFSVFFLAFILLLWYYCMGHKNTAVYVIHNRACRKMKNIVSPGEPGSGLRSNARMEALYVVRTRLLFADRNTSSLAQ